MACKMALLGVKAYQFLVYVNLFWRGQMASGGASVVGRAGPALLREAAEKGNNPAIELMARGKCNINAKFVVSRRG